MFFFLQIFPVLISNLIISDWITSTRENFARKKKDNGVIVDPPLKLKTKQKDSEPHSNHFDEPVLNERASGATFLVGLIFIVILFLLCSKRRARCSVRRFSALWI